MLLIGCGALCHKREKDLVAANPGLLHWMADSVTPSVRDRSAMQARRDIRRSR